MVIHTDNMTSRAQKFKIVQFAAIPEAKANPREPDSKPPCTLQGLSGRAERE